MTIQGHISDIQMYAKGHGHQSSNTNNNRQSINKCEVNCPQREGGGVHIFHVNYFLRGGGGRGLHVFHGSFFPWGLCALKQP